MTLQLVCTVQIHTIICNNINTVGQPVGWCITDKEDYDVIKLVLEKIKSRSPESQVSVIMTDDGELIHLTIKIPHIPHNMYYAVSSSCSTACAEFNCTRYLYTSIYLDNTGWSKAAHDVYGSELRHLLCRWHVDKYVINVTTTALCTVAYYIRSWRNNIRSKVTTPNQLEVYQTLCIMESEIDEAIFLTLIKSFITQWEKKESQFVAYFQEY